MTVTSKKRNKFNIFDYYEAYQQNKTQEGPTENNKTVISTEETITKIPNEKNIEVQILKVSENNKLSQSFRDSENSKSKLDTNNTIKNSVNDTTNLSEIITQEQNLIISGHTSKTSTQIKKKTSNEIFFTKIHTHSKISKLKLPEPENFTVPTDPGAKKDLFKAIFLSESESESEEEKEENTNNIKLIEMKKAVMEETKPEPPKEKSSTGKGFFADLDLTRFNKPQIRKGVSNECMENIDRIEENTKNTDSNYYGPKLPTTDTNTWRPTFNKASERLSKGTDSVNENWVEKNTKTKNKKHKSDKKHKKHKKHKSKHKKKKH